MTAADVALVAALVLGASAVQTVAGFGFGLLAVPAMSVVVPAHDAVLVSAIAAFATTVAATVHKRSSTDWRLVARLSATAVPGMLVGLLAYRSVGDDVLGIVLALFVVASLVWLGLDLSVPGVGTATDATAGFLSGVFLTSLSTNGPPLVFALHSRRLDADAFRGTIQSTFAICGAIGLTLFVLSGEFDREVVRMSCWAVPSALLGVAVGAAASPFVAGERFHRLTLTLLAVAALTAIATAV